MHTPLATTCHVNENLPYVCARENIRQTTRRAVATVLAVVALPMLSRRCCRIGTVSSDTTNTRPVEGGSSGPGSCSSTVGTPYLALAGSSRRSCGCARRRSCRLACCARRGTLRRCCRVGSASPVSSSLLVSSCTTTWWDASIPPCVRGLTFVFGCVRRYIPTTMVQRHKVPNTELVTMMNCLTRGSNGGPGEHHAVMPMNTVTCPHTVQRATDLRTPATRRALVLPLPCTAFRQ